MQQWKVSGQSVEARAWRRVAEERPSPEEKIRKRPACRRSFPNEAILDMGGDIRETPVSAQTSSETERPSPGMHHMATDR
jgi:hypothetical protein